MPSNLGDVDMDVQRLEKIRSEIPFPLLLVRCWAGSPLTQCCPVLSCSMSIKEACPAGPDMFAGLYLFVMTDLLELRRFVSQQAE